MHHLGMKKKLNLSEIPDFGPEFPKTISPHPREIFENCPRALRALGQFSKISLGLGEIYSEIPSQNQEFLLKISFLVTNCPSNLKFGREIYKRISL